jgi:protein-S-isoprenylcysteine O-methyltransferase Ste14
VPCAGGSLQLTPSSYTTLCRFSRVDDLSTHNADERTSGRSVPRGIAVLLGLVVWLVAIPIGHGVVPWATSILTVRHGWVDGLPGWWNRFGSVPIVGCVALLVWTAVVGFAATPARVPLRLTPNHLVTRGPYRFTRNPMYLGELGLWFGWAIVYGSVAVSIGFALLCVIVHVVILPREERALRVRVGDMYREYEARTPRWL